MVDLIIPAVVERMYRDLARFKPSQPQSTRGSTATKKVELTRADVDAIIRRKRGASPEELQYIISREKEFSLTNTQRDQLAVDLTIVVAQRARQANGPDHPSAEFIAKVLGYSETPYGLIERGWVNAELRAGSQAIQRCRYHRPPECQCWAAVRASLWQAGSAGEKTPEAWGALHIYDFLAEFEFASRPEAGAIQATD